MLYRRLMLLPWCASALIGHRPAVRRSLRSRLYHRSEKIPIYIEDTDAFNVVYYANYIRYLEYVLNVIREKDFPQLCHIEEARYKVPARLGDEIVIDTSDNGHDSYFHTISRVSDNAVILTAKTRLDASDMSKLKDAHLVERTAVQYNDIDPRLTYVSLDACLRWFERSRTNLIGGPSELCSFLEANKVAVVVCRIENLDYKFIDNYWPDSIETSTKVKLRSKFIIFEQQVSIPGPPDMLVAQATVTCLCSDIESGKPVAIPEDLRERLLSTSSST